MPQPIEDLIAKRSDILAEIQALGDLHRGSIAERYRKCGKHPCCCESRNHPGHGPYYSLTFKVEAKTVTRQLRPGPMLEKARREIEAFRQLQLLVGRLIEVNEQICELRPVEPLEHGRTAREARKKKSRKSSRKRSRGKSTA